jgi:drug/metabolite transporter (DMT)-like permease
MIRAQTYGLTLLALIAFAGNSLLCRFALKYTAIDPASFTSIRIISGAVVLWLIVRLRAGNRRLEGYWRSAFSLFAYAAAFSFAYIDLTAATGALLLFGAVQTTMIGYGLSHGERFSGRGMAGFALALSGLVALLLPGLAAPPLISSLLMLGAGIAWGIYSLRGKGAGDPTAVTAGNFARAVPFALSLSLAMLPWSSIDAAGARYAMLSGAIASGIGYVIWYTALRGLNATEAATVQLSVPVIAAIGGILFLGEPVTLRLLLGAVAILGGVALVIVPRQEGRL